jgi:hypothetical protein
MKNQTIPKDCYTASKMYIDRIPILGKPRDIVTIKRIIADGNVQPVASGHKKATIYRVSDVEDAFRIHLNNSGRPTNSSNNPHDEELVDIKKEISKETLLNLKNKNKIAAKDIEKMGLQIEQLKARLVDYEECYKYLVTYKSVMTALVRRILITDVPMSVCGLEIDQARPVCEVLYNEFIHALIETTNLWQKKYAVGNDREFELEVEKAIWTIVNGTSKTNTGESK